MPSDVLAVLRDLLTLVAGRACGTCRGAEQPCLVRGRLCGYLDAVSDCTVFLDANLALHFRPMDQIEWPALTGCSACVVAIAPILLRELEEQKVFNRSSVLRARAAKTISFLVGKMAEPDPVSLRAGTTLLFVDHEPPIDFDAVSLSRAINDDHYIASALDHARSAGARTLIASNDAGMAAKLRSRAVGLLRLPDDHALPAEVDPEQKELQEARKELARVRAAKPSLSVAFKAGRRRLDVSSPSALVSNAPDLSAIMQQHPKVATRSGRDFRNQPGVIGRNQLGGFGSVVGAERDDVYNLRLDAYYGDYQRFLADESVWLDRVRRSKRLDMLLKNDGGAVATNVDVTVGAPAGVGFADPQDWPSRPQAPKPPSRPNTIGAALANARHRDVEFPASFAPRLHPGALHIIEEGRAARFRAMTLKPKCDLQLDEFMLVRDSGLGLRGVELEVEITFNEGEPLRQKLAVIFTDTGETITVA